MVKVTKKVIDARIATIGNGELSFKTEMGAVSRELLVYIQENGDIDCVNRLMAVLTPINRDKAKTYFNHFLPYMWETKAARFGSKSKNKDLVKKKEGLTAEFLEDKDANIWTWFAEQGGTPVAKPKEFEKKIEDLVRKAITDKNESISHAAVVRAVIKAGISLSEIMAALLTMHDIAEEQQATETETKDEAATGGKGEEEGADATAEVPEDKAVERRRSVKKTA